MEERSAINPNAEVNAAVSAIAGAAGFSNSLALQYALNVVADILIPKSSLSEKRVSARTGPNTNQLSTLKP